jgi:hypothetical protein
MALKKALSMLDRLLLGLLLLLVGSLGLLPSREAGSATEDDATILRGATAGELDTVFSAWIWTFWAVTIVFVGWY